jgi:hypothetical protein
LKHDVCLYGLGKVFNDLAPYFLVRLGGGVVCVSDGNISNAGKTFLGLPYIAPDVLPRDIGIIVLAQHDNMKEMFEELKTKGFMNVQPFIEKIF